LYSFIISPMRATCPAWKELIKFQWTGWNISQDGSVCQGTGSVLKYRGSIFGGSSSKFSLLHRSQAASGTTQPPVY
jgi:hypothetical protein